VNNEIFPTRQLSRGAIPPGQYSITTISVGRSTNKPAPQLRNIRYTHFCTWELAVVGADGNGGISKAAGR
jgi:hypothetical protein